MNGRGSQWFVGVRAAAQTERHDRRRDRQLHPPPPATRGRDDHLFSDDAITQIHDAARGKPRTVNNLAVAALITTCVTARKSSTRPPPAQPSAR